MFYWRVVPNDFIFQGPSIFACVTSFCFALQFDQLLMRNDYYSNNEEDKNYTKLTNYTVLTDDLKVEPIGKFKYLHNSFVRNSNNT